MTERDKTYRSPVAERKVGEIVGEDSLQHEEREVTSASEIRADSDAAQNDTELAVSLLIEKIERMGSPSSSDEETAAGLRRVEADHPPFQMLHQSLDILAASAKERSSFTRRINPFREVFDGPRRFWQERAVKKSIVNILPLLEEKLVAEEDAPAVLDAFHHVLLLMEDDGINTSLSPIYEMKREFYNQAAMLILAHPEAVLTMSRGEGVDTERLTAVLSYVVEKSYFLTKGMFGKPYDTKPFIKTFVPFLQSQLQKTDKNPEQSQDLYRACSVLTRPLIVSDDQTETVLGQGIFLQAFTKAPAEVAREMLTPYIMDAESLRVAKKQCAKLRGEVVKHLGLDYEAFFDADTYRDLKTPYHSIEEHFIANVVAANELEKDLPGAVRRLAEDYGILTFARYPKALLLRQLEREEDGERPYGVIFYPREDWNGVLYSGQRSLIYFASPANQAALNIRIFECAGKLDAVKRLIRLNRRYGEKQKIGFALVGAHADSEHMVFSSADGLGHVRSEDLSPVILAELKTFFSTDATVVFDACSIGVDKGLGQLFSSFGISVVAPDQPAILRWIHVKREGEILW